MPAIARNPFHLLLLVVALALIFRSLLIPVYTGFTSDMGSFLMTRNWVLMDDPTGHMLAHYRPPIIGAVLLPFTTLFGDLLGSKILAIIFSVTIGPAFYFLARQSVGPWLSFAGAAIIMHLPLYGDMTAGGYLSMGAFALLMLQLAGSTHDGWDKRYIALTVVSTFLLVGLNQTVAAWAFVIIGLVLLTKLVYTGWVSILPGLTGLVMGGLVSLAWLPFYILHAPIEGNPLRIENGPFIMLFLQPFLIFQVATVLIAMWWLRGRVIIFVIPVLLLSWIGNLGSWDIVVNNGMHRIAFLMPILTILIVLISLDRVKEFITPIFSVASLRRSSLLPQPITLHLMNTGIVLFFMLHLAWLIGFASIADPLDMLTEDNLAGIQWIEDNIDQETRTYVHPNGLGWWVGGLARRQWSGSWSTDAPLGFQDDQKAFNCTMWNSECGGPTMQELNLDYIFVDYSRSINIDNPMRMRSGDVIWDKVWALQERNKKLTLVFKQGSVVIYEVNSS